MVIIETEITRLKLKLAHAETALKFYANPESYDQLPWQTRENKKTEIVGDTYLKDGVAMGGARAMYYFSQFPDEPV